MVLMVMVMVMVMGMVLVLIVLVMMEIVLVMVMVMALVLIMVLMTTSGDWRGEAWCRPPSSILSGRCSGGSTRLTFEAGPWFVFDLMST